MKLRQNLDEDLLTSLFWFEFSFIISCSQSHSLLLFLSSVVFEVPSKLRSFQPVSVLLTAITSKSIWIIVIFSIQERLCVAGLEFLGQKSNQLPADFSYCLLFVFEISQKRKIIFCTVHLGTIDRVYKKLEVYLSRFWNTVTKAWPQACWCKWEKIPTDSCASLDLSGSY